MCQCSFPQEPLDGPLGLRLPSGDQIDTLMLFLEQMYFVVWTGYSFDGAVTIATPADLGHELLIYFLLPLPSILFIF